MAGHLDFWNSSEKQKHLYSIFDALDVTIGDNLFKNITASEIRAVDVASRSASRCVKLALDTNIPTNNIIYITNIVAAQVTYAIVGTTVAAYEDDIVKVAIVATKVADIANGFIEYSSLGITSDITEPPNQDYFQEVYLQDIEDLRENRPLNNNIKVYGKIWNNFQNSLKNEGCGYWGKLYTEIFENKFVLDKETLKRRLNVPPEIQDQGAKAVANYLIELEKGASRYLNEARIIILGEKGAGKTCLARRLIDPDAEMTTDDESTEGVDTTLWKIDNEKYSTEKKVNVHIWDFAGHVVAHAAHKFFLSERCLYIIVYDGRTEERNRMEYWLDHVKNYGGSSPIFPIGEYT
jgi:hypothetical protein